jgi:hypothetical protein
VGIKDFIRTAKEEGEARRATEARVEEAMQPLRDAARCVAEEWRQRLDPVADEMRGPVIATFDTGSDVVTVWERWIEGPFQFSGFPHFGPIVGVRCDTDAKAYEETGNMPWFKVDGPVRFRVQNPHALSLRNRSFNKDFIGLMTTIEHAARRAEIAWSTDDSLAAWVRRCHAEILRSRDPVVSACLTMRDTRRALNSEIPPSRIELALRSRRATRGEGG